jgi:dolichyl-phosphate beta-glucosyltransferase
VLDISIVIPTYYEANKIETDIRAAARFISQNGYRGEIIVVDDGSPDDTVARATALCDEFPNLAVYGYRPNRGKGHALRYGFARTSGRIAMYADAGLCVPYEIAKVGITMIDIGMCDVAHGSRRLRGSHNMGQPFHRRIGSRVFRAVIHAFMGIPRYFSDTQCGFKIYRGEVARELYDRVITDGFMYDPEMILQARKYGYKVLEFPVLWNADLHSRSNSLAGTIRNIKELAAIRLAFSPLARLQKIERIPVSEVVVPSMPAEVKA